MKLINKLFGDNSNRDFSPVTRKYYFDYVK